MRPCPHLPQAYPSELKSSPRSWKSWQLRVCNWLLFPRDWLPLAEDSHLAQSHTPFPRDSSRRRQWHSTPVLLPGKSHGQRSLVGCSPWGRKESDTTERLHFHFSLSCIGEGNGNPLQSSCLENPRDGGAWWAEVYGVTQSRTWLKRLSSSSRNSSGPVIVNQWQVFKAQLPCCNLDHRQGHLCSRVPQEISWDLCYNHIIGQFLPLLGLSFFSPHPSDPENTLK